MESMGKAVSWVLGVTSITVFNIKGRFGGI